MGLRGCIGAVLSAFARAVNVVWQGKSCFCEHLQNTQCIGLVTLYSIFAS